MAVIHGSDGADTLNGGAQDDTISGGAGADRILTGDGQDSVDAGDGDDEVNGYLVDAATGAYAAWVFDGAKQVAGGAGQDFLVGGRGADTLDGGTGDDRLYGGSGNDLLLGGDGADLLYDQGSGQDTLRGGAGDDLLSGYGSADGDSLDGGDGDDTLAGGSGNDTLDGGAGVDLLQGGDGDDHYWIRDASDRIVDSGGDDTAYVAVDGVKLPDGIEHVVYVDGAQPLPYWLDALVADSSAGLYPRTLLGADRTIAYCFPTALPAYDDQAQDALGFTPFTASQAARAREALALIGSLCDLRFVETSEPAAPNTIAFANNQQSGTAGYAWLPSALWIGSDVFLDSDSAGNLTMPDGAQALLTLVHELGHALGLKHPFAAGAEPPYLPAAEDGTDWTVMSYSATPAAFALRYAALDIAALQYLYGPAPTARAGDDRYLLSDTAANLLWDGGGTDLVDASALAQGVTLHLDPGHWDSVGGVPADRITAAGQITIHFGSAIEDLLGSAQADQLFGSALANHIAGGGGDDRIEGGAGADRLDGDAGDDSLNGGAGDDTLAGGAGRDSAVYAGARADYSLAFDPVSGALTVRAHQGDEGVDVLSGIEELRFADGTLALDAQAARTVAVTVTQAAGGGALAGVALDLGGQAASTAANGQATVGGVGALGAQQVAVGASLPIDGAAARAAADAAVDLQDAIAVLRLVVGLADPATGQAWTPLQARAADFDRSGTVGLGDAIAVLRHVVGLDAPAPQWLFLDAADPALAGPTRLDPGPLPALALDLGDPADPLPLQLLGVLSGDVNGSLLWPVATPATGT